LYNLVANIYNELTTYGSSIDFLSINVDIKEEDIFDELIKEKPLEIQRKIMKLKRRKRNEEEI